MDKKEKNRTGKIDNDVKNLLYWSEAILDTIGDEEIEGVHFKGDSYDVFHNLLLAIDKIKNDHPL